MSLTEDERQCPMCDRDLTHVVNGTTYSKAYLVEVRGVYDGGLYYRDVEGCGKAWHRWSAKDAYSLRLHNLAEPYIQSVNEKVKLNAAGE